jgi:hypothetical protein
MMDFLDPKKTRAHTVRLIIGYVLVAITLGLATTVLLYMANGFGVKQGKVIQNGLVFISSSPSGSSIYLNDTLQSDKTNAKLMLPAGTYTMRLNRDGYRDWQRAVTVEGGSVDRFDYPLLFPKTLTTTASATYASAPQLVTQSPDRRWLLVQQPGGPATFDVYDIKDPKKVKTDKKTISLPAAVPGIPVTAASNFKMVEWSNDNSHVLLRHSVGEQSEYIILSRDKPEESVNVSRQLQLAKTAVITLQDKQYDRYFIHDSASLTLSTASLDNPRPTSLLTGVISYKSYGTDVILYATTESAGPGKTSVKMYQAGNSYPIRQVAQDSSYLLDISRYRSSWYVVVGSPSEDHVYVYQDPTDSLRQEAGKALTPVEVMKLDKPKYVEFSANSQFVMAENGKDISVFDAQNERSYIHQLDKPIDTPQSHVTWMDGYHLRLVSNGAATVFDYDGTNAQTLAASSPDYLIMFDTGYSSLYTLAPATEAAQAGQMLLNATPLRTLADQ